MSQARLAELGGAAPLRFASVNSTYKDSSAEFCRRCERRQSCHGHQKRRFKLIHARSRTVTSIETLFMEALVFGVRVMTPILYLTV